MESQSDLIFLKLLQDSIESLNKLDEMIETNGQRQSEIDSELSDLLHLIEHSELNDLSCIKITHRIQELRKIRHGLRNEHELIIKYQEVKAKLSSKENRQFITTEIQKRLKTLNQEYKNRVLTDEQITELVREEPLTVEKNTKIRKMSEKTKQMNDRILELLSKGCTQKEIAVELNVSQGCVSQKIKKIKELQNA